MSETKHPARAWLVLLPLRHGTGPKHTTYHSGQTVHLSEDEASRLLRAGVIQPAPDKAPSAAPDNAPASKAPPAAPGNAPVGKAKAKSNAKE